MKKGLVLEGGAMRGMYTAGVIDVLMENNIEFDGIIGVSAGAAFGCNYKSKQPGRAIRYNKNYCNDKRYVSLRNLITTGDLYGVDFCYRQLPDELDIFDTETFKSSPMEFYATCTDALTGEPVYHKCETGGKEDIQWFRASASMPLASNIVRIGDYHLSDGGTADSIPLKYFQSIGYEKNIVVLTQPEGYVKKKNSLIPLMKIMLRKYPALVEACATRHIRYNETLEYIKKQVAENNILVIQPKEKLLVNHVEHDKDKLEITYQTGRCDALEKLCEINDFLNS
ncbi:MAG: patatin family protein [Clostridia bacterium]|nr:patatin family protein [Clostridia bacterium]